MDHEELYMELLTIQRHIEAASDAEAATLECVLANSYVNCNNSTDRALEFLKAGLTLSDRKRGGKFQIAMSPFQPDSGHLELCTKTAVVVHKANPVAYAIYRIHPKPEASSND